jgi:hypothetical protein
MAGSEKLWLMGSWAHAGSWALVARGIGLSGSWVLGLMGSWALWYKGSWALLHSGSGRYSDATLTLLDAEAGEQFSPHPASTALEHFKVCSLNDFGLRRF